jgi:hypothetical protein
VTYVLRIQHSVPDYAAWKEAFDGDPIGREESGVRRHRVQRAVDDPGHVMIDLEFDDADQAEAFHGKLEELWARVQVMRDPSARLVEVVDSQEY